MSIYTKKGDRGKTNSYSSKKLTKDSLKIQAIGTIDEVNSFLAIVVSGTTSELRKDLKEIQKDLFTIGSILAGAKLRFNISKVKRLEEQIDELEKGLPRLRNFILPGGSLEGAQLHFARTLTRRAERTIVALGRKEKIKPQIPIYLNRLSDFLFILARKVNYDKGIKEEIWKSG